MNLVDEDAFFLAPESSSIIDFTLSEFALKIPVPDTLLPSETGLNAGEAWTNDRDGLV